MSVALKIQSRRISSVEEAPSPRGQLLMRVLEVLEREQVPYCLLHGYDKFPQTVAGDVDCLIPARFLPDGLAKILHAHREEIGAKVVQWFEDGAHFIVLAGRADDGKPILLQLHVSTRYEMAGRIFFEPDEILLSRRRHNGFWIPSAAVEFACVLANRLIKADLTESHIARLTYLYQLDPGACDRQATRLLPRSGTMIITAAETGNWLPSIVNIRMLGTELVTSAPHRSRQTPASFFAKICRWIRPRNGFHAVFLGPDGVGKSTTIEAFQRDIAPAFLHTQYLTFAPGLLPKKFAAPKPGGPHSLPPRSYPASLLKAAWWFVCYTLGYFASLHPTLARAGLVINHRYLVDAIVDRKRYRYSGPVWLLQMIWFIAPKPDVVFLLDADPELIQSRKQEVPFAETSHQVQAYRNAIAKLPMGKILDASLTREEVAAKAEWFVLDRMAERVARRFSLGGLQ